MIAQLQLKFGTQKKGATPDYKILHRVSKSISQLITHIRIQFKPVVERMMKFIEKDCSYDLREMSKENDSVSIMLRSALSGLGESNNLSAEQYQAQTYAKYESLKVGDFTEAIPNVIRRWIEVIQTAVAAGNGGCKQLTTEANKFADKLRQAVSTRLQQVSSKRVDMIGRGLKMYKDKKGNKGSVGLGEPFPIEAEYQILTQYSKILKEYHDQKSNGRKLMFTVMASGMVHSQSVNHWCAD